MHRGPSRESIPALLEVLDERFKAVPRRLASRAALRRLPLGGGAGLLAGRALPGVERHPQRPDAALGRDDRHGRRLPRSRPATPTATPLDRQGRLVSCEHGNRRVTRTEHDGSITVLADRYDGKRLNSPNDVVVRSDGSIWFTDPRYGIDSDYEGHRATSEIGACHVYRIDPSTGEVRIVADDFERPNGLAFSLDERALYIVDTAGQPHPRLRRRRATARSPAARSSPSCTPAASTASASTTPGGIWAAAGDGVHCFDPDGTLIGKLHLPEVVLQPHLRRPAAQPPVHHARRRRSTRIRLTVNGAPTGPSAV